MSSLNKVILIGNVGKDPEIRATHDGREVANITLATSERWTDKSGEKKEKTEWHKVNCFNPGLVDVIRKYLRKGSKVYIEGQLQTRKWQDKDGNDKYSTEVTLQGYNCQLIILDKLEKSEGGESDFAKSAKQQAEKHDSNLNDDIPF